MSTPTPVPGACLHTKLPDGLKPSLATIKTGVTQWSRITAWSWCDYLAFSGDKGTQETNLKKLLIGLLKGQAQQSDAYISYGAPDSKAIANKYAQNILYLLLGQNAQVTGADDIVPDAANITVTLSDVIEKTTGEPLVTSIPQNEAFTKSFFVQVITGEFSGRIADAPDDCKTATTPYINYIAYPPRPELGELTVTEDDLRKWASNQDSSGSYLPPSVYIPTAFS